MTESQFLLIDGLAYACFAYIPLEDRIGDSDLVVVGRIVKEGKPFALENSGKPAPAKGARHWYVVGEIAVRETLKGAPLKTVSLAYPMKPPPSGYDTYFFCSTDLPYSAG